MADFLESGENLFFSEALTGKLEEVNTCALSALEALGEKPVLLGEIVPGEEGVILW